MKHITNFKLEQIFILPILIEECTNGIFMSNLFIFKKISPISHFWDIVNHYSNLFKTFCTDEIDKNCSNDHQ